MHSRFRTKGVVLAVFAALIALLALPTTSLAKPKPGAPGRGFRLQARAIGAITINRVYCGLAATGEVCVDSTNSSTIGGGYWPKGSPQQYVFNSGLQAAGAIDTAGGWAWAGDTTGAFFFDPKGTTQHGQLVQPIWNSASPADNNAWPDAARVPEGDAVADLFDVNLQGRKSASQGDIWTLAWDGDPSLIAGRPHPLGIAVETRGLGWNYPTGNNDIVYFIYTFYNITSTCDADYAAIRPTLRDQMKALGVQFQALNNAAFGVTIPTCGYTIKDFYANFAADMDVSSDAGNNYSSVNLPFSLGYVYEDTFRPTEGTYRLPTDQAPALGYTGGYGFVGVKYLRSPIDPNTNMEAGIRLFSNTVNGSSFNDPQNVQQLYRYISGAINPALGDGLCNFSPSTDKICFVKSDGHADMRFFQSSGPFDLAPGAFGSIVVGYVFASAIAVPGCPTSPCGVTSSVLPGDPRRLSNAAQLATGANLIDSLAGFAGYVDGSNGNPLDSIVQQGEVLTVPGSLLNKSLRAQAVFDGKFLLPSAPDAPEFFLVPGDNQVTVVWRASASEATGDVFFNSSNNPSGLLYDPNYRQYDIEGYRVYRGRVDDPSALRLLAQFDYGAQDSEGHDLTFYDYLGVVNPTPDCAPELGVETGCAVDFDNPTPPAPYVVNTGYQLVSPFLQVKLGNRTLLASGEALVLSADTAVTGHSGAVTDGMPDLTDTGVPFVYVDGTAKNNLRYFYAVTAFDVNSVQSGPTSLESARITKSTTPTHTATDYAPQVTTTLMIRGRGVLKDPAAPLPALDPVNGTFSGPMPAADGADLGLVGPFLREVVNGSGQFFARLDSLHLGQVDLSGCCAAGGAGVPAHYYFTVSNGASSTQIDIPLQQDLGVKATGQGLFDGIVVDNGFGGRYGGGSDFSLLAAIKPTIQPVGYAGGSGLAAALGEPGFAASDFANAGTSGFRYDGPRWFDGANETFAHPTAGHCGTGTGACGSASLASYVNAGSMADAPLVYIPQGYLVFNREWRNVDAVLGSARRAADVRVYWGAGGVVDSVIDLTHNVPLTFDSAGGTDPNARLGAGWAILNTANTSGAASNDGRANTLTPLDWMCVEPFKSQIPGAQGFFPCPGPVTYAVSKTAVLGPVAVGVGDNQSTTAAGSVKNTANNNGGNGFSMYVAGVLTFFGQMTALPAAGTTWTLRTYSGAVFGGNPPGAAPGDLGPYKFVSRPRPMTAVGAEVVFGFNVSQNFTSTSEKDLDRVHTVPDPYYVTNAFESSPSGKIVRFVNLPSRAIIRIYSTSGVLVRVIEHNSTTFGGSENWDVRNRNNQVVASGVYFYHVESPSGARRVGRMTIVNFAQ